MLSELRVRRYQWLHERERERRTDRERERKREKNEVNNKSNSNELIVKSCLERSSHKKEEKIRLHMVIKCLKTI